MKSCVKGRKKGKLRERERESETSFFLRGIVKRNSKFFFFFFFFIVQKIYHSNIKREKFLNQIKNTQVGGFVFLSFLPFFCIWFCIFFFLFCVLFLHPFFFLGFWGLRVWFEGEIREEDGEIDEEIEEEWRWTFIYHFVIVICS